MRIGIEGKVLNPRAGGIGRYSINLTRSLLELAGKSSDAPEFVVFTGPRSATGSLRGLEGRFAERRLAARSSVLRSLVSLPAGIAREKVGLFHGLDHVGVPLVRAGCRYVVTIHDLLPIEQPQWFRRRHRLVVATALQRVIPRAARIIVPSWAVRRSLLRRFRVDERKVAVVAEGCEARFRPSSDPDGPAAVRSRYGLPGRYVLFVGTHEPRKNLATLVAAFARVVTTSPREADDLGLVLAGGRGWHDRRLRRAVAELGLDERVVLPGFVDDADLPDLYRGAELFVFPSLQEGFGLPVLEAMGCGVPVLSSDTSALPEVAGDAAAFVDPLDTRAMADALRGLLEDDAWRATLRARGLRRARGMTWRAAARATLDVYREVAA